MTTRDILMQLLRSQAQISKKLDRALSLQGISLSEYQVLEALSAAPERSMRRIDLADAVGLSASGVTRLLNPLEKIGLVGKQSSERDARVSLVTITAAGQRTLADAHSRFDETANTLFAPLGEPMRRQLADLLATLGQR